MAADVFIFLFVFQETVREEDVGVNVPSGRWRLGVPCPRTRAVLIRYCTRSDKKAGMVERKVERIPDPQYSHNYGEFKADGGNYMNI